MGMFWNPAAVGSTRLAWNSRLPWLKPRKTPTMQLEVEEDKWGMYILLDSIPVLRRIKRLQLQSIERCGFRT